MRHKIRLFNFILKFSLFKIGESLLNQILSRGMAPKLKKEITSVNAV